MVGQKIYSSKITPSPSVEQVGGKGFQLFKLVDARFQTPPFFILSSSFVDDILSPVRRKIEASTEEEGSIKKLIMEQSFDQKTKQEIEQFFLSHFNKKTLVSVRSSAISEDSGENSFAGQHQTSLFVSFTELEQKIKESIASAWSKGAIAYRKQHRISTQNIRYAVVIQEMIYAQKSGIAFSMDVHANMADVAIVAAYGAGEGVVSDKADSDTFYITRSTKEIRNKINIKKTALVFEKEKGLQFTKINADLQSAPVLNSDEIKTIAEQVLKAEKMLNSIADIEFSIDENGNIFILQARAVTHVNSNDIKILDNTNISESYPEVTLPLSFSFARTAYEKTFMGASKGLWISQDFMIRNQELFRHLLEHYQGRVFYRLDNWYQMISLVFSSEKSIAAWEKAVGLNRAAHQGIPLSKSAKLKILASTIFTLLRYKGGNKKFYKKFNEHFAFLQSYREKKMDAKALYQHYEEAGTRLFHIWYLTLINDLVTFKSFGKLQEIIVKNNIGKEEMANDLICGLSKSESEESILQLLELKEEIASTLALRELFNLPSPEILQQLHEEKHLIFVQKIQAHIDRFGDRTLAELKLESTTFRQAPEQFIDLIKAQLTTENNKKQFLEKQESIRKEARKIFNTSLAWWNYKKWLGNFLIKLSAYGIKNRENMRFCRTRVYGNAKDIFLTIGEEMQSNGYIKAREDIFYLELEEVKKYAFGERSFLSETYITERKKEYEKYSGYSVPDRIIYSGEIPPILKQNEKQTETSEDMLNGVSVSRGIIRAEAIVITQPNFTENIKGKILITKITDPGWVFLMAQASGLISERGSLLSHTAIVGRELGIPVLVGVSEATQRIKSGDIIELNSHEGKVRIIERKK